MNKYKMKTYQIDNKKIRNDLTNHFLTKEELEEKGIIGLINTSWDNSQRGIIWILVNNMEDYVVDKEDFLYDCLQLKTKINEVLCF